MKNLRLARIKIQNTIPTSFYSRAEITTLLRKPITVISPGVLSLSLSLSLSLLCPSLLARPMGYRERLFIELRVQRGVGGMVTTLYLWIISIFDL